MNEIRPIAYYLPQFHPIQENDEWWGKGFTEWTNVVIAKSLFKGHKQPHLPADLGFYDLRVPEVRDQQAQLARKAGIEGFCYWHYWFGNGTKILERPFKEVLESGKPDFPFCLAWANETWSGIWHGAKNRILIKQTYPGVKDYERHFYEILPGFLDNRYIRVDSKPLFLIYNPTDLPNMQEFCDTFNNLAIKNNLNGIYLIANNIWNVKINWDPGLFGFSAYTIASHNRIIHDDNSFYSKIIREINRKYVLKRWYNRICKRPLYTYKYEKALKYFLLENDLIIDFYPTVITGWDNTPRCGKDGYVLTGYSPELFRKHLKQVLPIAQESRNKIVFIKSWNEWAEGNYLEPESEYGIKFLEVLKEELNSLRSLEILNSI